VELAGVSSMEEPSLEGWDPEPSDALPLARIVDRAFDYRGNTTIVKTDGTQLEGYLFNRNEDVPEPFVQIFDVNSDGPVRIRYSEIRTIRFTGRDPAAGSSYAAWLRRKEDAAKTVDPPVDDDRPSPER
jgi:hypothetical protein